MAYDYHILEKYLEEKGWSLSEDAKQKLSLFYECLIEKNKVMNLTAITEWDEVITKHFVDSLSILEIRDLSDFHGRLLDLGTGAGFPGIPLKIVFPELSVTLVDSLNKRILFLWEVMETLDLKEIEAIHSRAEDIGHDPAHREAYDLVVSRAVANLSVLSEYCLPLVKMGGSFISYKSRSLEEELPLAKHGISVLGGSLRKKVSFSLPDASDERTLVELKKEKPTPKKYPRKAGLPAKEPLS